MAPHTTLLANYFMNQYETLRDKFTLQEVNDLLINVMGKVYNLKPQAMVELRQVGPDYAAAVAYGHAHRDPNFMKQFVDAINPSIVQQAVSKFQSLPIPAQAMTGIAAATLLYKMVQAYVNTQEEAPGVLPQKERLLTPNELRIIYDQLVRKYPFTDPKNKVFYEENRKLEQRQQDLHKYRNKLVERVNQLDFANPVDRVEIKAIADALEGRDDTASANITNYLKKTPELPDETPWWQSAIEFVASAPDGPKIDPLFGIDPKLLPDPIVAKTEDKLESEPKPEGGNASKWDSLISRVSEREAKSGGKVKSESAWTKHVKKYAKEHNKTFFESLKLAKPSYKK